MQRSRLELNPGLWLDARRALWLAEPRALLVADLHLGYAWAHRERGNLLPIGAGENTIARLQALVTDYAPREFFVLGDVIHGTVGAEAVLDELRALHELADGVQLRLIAGNHDSQLAAMLRQAGLPSEVRREILVGENLLLHGDGANDEMALAKLRAARERGGRIIMGHEHPALALSDGVATTARCPCFLAGEEAIVLPAFSAWSSGTDVRSGNFLSAYTRRARFARAIAIVAGKLLPLPL
jgi:DNA ligase-associated metallophosphoesterase